MPQGFHLVLCCEVYLKYTHKPSGAEPSAFCFIGYENACWFVSFLLCFARFAGFFAFFLRGGLTGLFALFSSFFLSLCVLCVFFLSVCCFSIFFLFFLIFGLTFSTRFFFVAFPFRNQPFFFLCCNPGRRRKSRPLVNHLPVGIACSKSNPSVPPCLPGYVVFPGTNALFFQVMVQIPQGAALRIHSILEKSTGRGTYEVQRGGGRVYSLSMHGGSL